MGSVASIPNILSLSRIVLAFALFFSSDHPVPLFALVVLCGITDVLDGYLARKLHCESNLGARLDSLGDLVYYSALTLYVVRFQMPLIQPYLGGIIAIFVIKTLTLAVSKVKNGRIYSLHTYGNKLTGVMVVVSICLILLTGTGLFVALLVVVGILSALEELLIMSLFKEPDTNTRSIFQRKNAGRTGKDVLSG
ncbi:CDP-alcohol phosphatidyltransferase family protein [Sphaerochaeta sp.]|uniref:CDP-alcohol phosphatidyltransferase family protein n=1 Tax=Sphaerochaeta sp. TaxID=1972642 RepID=UPI003D12CE5E